MTILYGRYMYELYSSEKGMMDVVYSNDLRRNTPSPLQRTISYAAKETRRNEDVDKQIGMIKKTKRLKSVCLSVCLYIVFEKCRLKRLVRYGLLVSTR